MVEQVPCLTNRLCQGMLCPVKVSVLLARPYQAVTLSSVSLSEINAVTAGERRTHPGWRQHTLRTRLSTEQNLPQIHR